MHVAIGSTNPAKIFAVRSAFATAAPSLDVQVDAIPVVSAVSAQPMTEAETVAGAYHRAVQAIKLARADFGVGIEGGLCELGDQWFSGGWAVIVDQAGHVSKAATVKVAVPPEVMHLIRRGVELEEACRRLYAVDRSAEKTGFVGLVTGDLLTRADTSRDALVAALSPLLQTLYGDRQLVSQAS